MCKCMLWQLTLSENTCENVPFHYFFCVVLWQSFILKPTKIEQNIIWISHIWISHKMHLIVTSDCKSNSTQTILFAIMCPSHITKAEEKKLFPNKIIWTIFAFGLCMIQYTVAMQSANNPVFYDWITAIKCSHKLTSIYSINNILPTCL